MPKKKRTRRTNTLQKNTGGSTASFDAGTYDVRGGLHHLGSSVAKQAQENWFTSRGPRRGARSGIGAPCPTLKHQVLT